MTRSELKKRFPNRGFTADEGFIVNGDYLCDECAPDGDYESLDFAETDHPVHCEKCQALIITNLTDYGQNYVRDQYRESRNVITKLWRKEFSYAWDK